MRLSGKTYQQTTTIAVLAIFLSVPQLRFSVAPKITSFPHSWNFVAYQSQQATTRTNGKIAFSSDRNGFLDIYVMNADGSNQRQLTFGAVNPTDGFRRTGATNPMWSPDGRRIAFIGNLEYQKYNLNVMNADGTRIKKITDGINVSYATWSPDGTTLLFSDACGSIDNVLCPINIYRVNVDGTGLTKLTNNTTGTEDLEPAWSPDGTKIAFISIKDNDWTGIYVMNTDGTNRLRLTSSQANDDSPKWSQDGSKIAFKRSYDAFGTDGDV